MTPEAIAGDETRMGKGSIAGKGDVSPSTEKRGGDRPSRALRSAVPGWTDATVAQRQMCLRTLREGVHKEPGGRAPYTGVPLLTTTHAMLRSALTAQTDKHLKDARGRDHTENWPRTSAPKSEITAKA